MVCSISEYLSHFLSATKSFENFPSDVDETVVDHLIDVINIDSNVAEVVLSSCEDVVQSTNILSCSIHLKFLNKIASTAPGLLPSERVFSIVRMLIKTANISKNPSLLLALFQIMICMNNTNTPFPEREEIIKTAFECLRSETTSIFVQRKASEYISCIIDEQTRSDIFYYSVEILCDTQSTHVLECVSNIILRNTSVLSEEYQKRIVNSAKTKVQASSAYALLVAKILEKNQSDIATVWSNEWRSNVLQMRIIEKLICECGITELASRFLALPSIRLSQVLACLPVISLQAREEVVKAWLPFCLNAKKCPTADLAKLLGQLQGTKISCEEVFGCLSSRFLQSPVIASAFFDAFWPVKDEVMTQIRRIIKEGIEHSSWEFRDAAIDMCHMIYLRQPYIPLEDDLTRKIKEALDDESHFVRSNALRFLGAFEADSVLTLAAKKFIADSYTEVRVEAANILLQHGGGYRTLCIEALPVLLSDCDLDVREIGVKIASMICGYDPKLDEDVRRILQKFLQDETECRMQIETVLKEKFNLNSSDVRNGDIAEKLVRDMIRSLQIDTSEIGVVKDCY